MGLFRRPAVESSVRPKPCNGEGLFLRLSPFVCVGVDGAMIERVKTIATWRRLEPFRKISALPLGIYSVSEFQQILRYEWIRSERERGRLSLAVFELNHNSGKTDTNGSPILPKILVTNLRQAVRATDHVGWYDNKNVAVLLPGATEDEANRFSVRIRRRISTDPGRTPVRVYSYLNKWSGGSNAEKKGNDPDAASSE